MADIKIADLPSAEAVGTSVVPVSNAAGTATNKVTLADIAALASGAGDDARWDLLKPPAPTSVTAAPGNAQATVSWAAPTVLAQTPITDYTVQFSRNSGATWTTFTRAASTATSATVTSLTNGTSYVFRVAAVNGVGVGSFSSASAAVTAEEPIISITSQPSSQTASAGSATFSVTASVTVSATLSYQWQRSTDSGSTWANVSGATASSLSLTGLVNGSGDGHRYRVIVSATGGATSVTSNAVTLTVQFGPVFSNVSVSVPSNWPPNIASIQTATVSGNNTSVLSIAMSIPNGTLGGNLRVAFTVTEPVILTADDTVITGGDGASLTFVSNTNQPGWYTDKFGSGGYEQINFRYSGDNANTAANWSSPAPTRLRLLAGTYTFNIDFWQNSGTAKSLSAAFTLFPADTGKIFDAGTTPYVWDSGYPPASSGLYTKKLLLPPATPASPNYRKNYSIPYIYRNTDTSLRLTASSDSYYRLTLPGWGGNPPSSQRSPQPQPEGGWIIGGGGSQQRKFLTGSQDFTIWTVPSEAYSSNIGFETFSPGVSAWSLEILS